jgi:proline racemase
MIGCARQGVHHIIWCDASKNVNAHGRSAVFYGDKGIDRSPGGTGTSARMAQLFGKGQLSVGAVYRNESLIGTIFEGKVEAAVGVGEFEGILPSVGGWAEIIGHNTIFVDDEDPLAHGFSTGLKRIPANHLCRAVRDPAVGYDSQPLVNSREGLIFASGCWSM